MRRKRTTTYAIIALICAALAFMLYATVHSHHNLLPEIALSRPATQPLAPMSSPVLAIAAKSKSVSKKKPPPHLASGSLSSILAKAGDSSIVQQEQKAITESLLQQGKYDAALTSAKSYYNVAELKDTKDAVELIAKALEKESNPEVVSRFREQQLAGGLPADAEVVPAPTTVPSNTSVDNPVSPSLDPGATGGNVLATIAVDLAPYSQAIDRYRHKTDSIDSQIAAGNLLLLADRPEEAKEAFETASQLATKGKGGKTRMVRDALDGIARSTRDAAGIAQADAYVLSLKRQATLPTTGAAAAAGPARSVRAASAELTISGIGDGNPSWPTLSSYESPATKAAADTKIAAWLTDWQNDAANGALISSERRVALKQLLTNTSLSCLNLIDIGRAICLQSQDEHTASVFYFAAAYKAHDELRSYAPSSAQARPILVALNGIKPVLWHVVDGSSHEGVDALCLLSNDLINGISPGDKSLQPARAHAFIAFAECLYLMGEIAEATQAATSIDTTEMTESQKVAVAWIRALTLSASGRHAEAVPALEIVAKHTGFAYSKAASSLLPRSRVLSIVETSNTKAEASRRFSDFLKDQKLNVIDTKQMELVFLNGGKNKF